MTVGDPIVERISQIGQFCDDHSHQAHQQAGEHVKYNYNVVHDVWSTIIIVVDNLSRTFDVHSS